MDQQNDIGLIGLAVMGQNLVLNMANHGFSVGVFNRTTSKVDEFLAGPAKGKSIRGYHALPELIAGLKPPRKIMMMVKAGPAVDELIGRARAALDARRHPDRRRQHALSRHRAAHETGRSQGPALRRHRRLRRRRGCAQGAEHHAWRHKRRVAARSSPSCRRSPPRSGPRRMSPAASGSAKGARATTSK